MSQFVVDATSLQALRTELGTLHTRLAALPSVVYGFEGLLGGDNMDQAVEDFCTSWHHSVSEVAGEVHDLMGGLDNAVHAYQEIDDRVRRRAATGWFGGPGKQLPGRLGATPVTTRQQPRSTKSGTGRGTGTGDGGAPLAGGGGSTTSRGHDPDRKQPAHASRPPTHAGAAPITVTDSHLTASQEVFVAKLAAITNLSPRVVAAWVTNAGGGADGSDNFLNMAGVAEGPAAAHDPNLAAAQTAYALRHSEDPSIQAILATGGRSPEQQLKAIADSGLGGGQPDGGAALRGHYRELSGLTVAVA